MASTHTTTKTKVTMMNSQQHSASTSPRTTHIDPHQTALLVIDMQCAFVDPSAPLCVAGAQATVPAIAQAVAHARDLGVRIVWVRRAYARDGSDMEAFRREALRKAGTLDAMAEGSTGAELASGLEALPGDITIVKKRFSAFFGTGLFDTLHDQGITTVVLAGTQTPNCIRATAFDAVSLDLRTIILAPCTSSATPAIQQANLEDMARIGIEVVDDVTL